MSDKNKIEDFVEGVFIIEAKSKNTFFNRKQRLEEITGFSDGFFDTYEEDDDGGVWKIITQAYIETIDELKAKMKSMEKYKWFFDYDMSLMLDGEYLFVDGEWKR